MRKKEKRRRKMKMKVLAIVAMALVATTIVNPNAKAGSNDNIIVTIKGNVKTVDFNGELQSSIGHTVEISNPIYTEDDFVWYSTDSISATNAGIYPMGMSSSEFCNVNPNFKNVIFVVIDGSLCINDSQPTYQNSLAKE